MKIVRLAILMVALMVVFVGQTPKIVLGANVTVAPTFAALYTATDLGAVPGLNTSGTGGIAVKPGDPNTMLIMGRTDTNATLYSFGVLGKVHSLGPPSHWRTSRHPRSFLESLAL